MLDYFVIYWLVCTSVMLLAGLIMSKEEDIIRPAYVLSLCLLAILTSVAFAPLFVVIRGADLVLWLMSND